MQRGDSAEQQEDQSRHHRKGQAIKGGQAERTCSDACSQALREVSGL